MAWCCEFSKSKYFFRYSGGNSVQVQPIPGWQKGIGSFFNKANKSNEENEVKDDNKLSENNKDENFSSNGLISEDED